MRPHWKDQLKQWICKVFGHKFYKPGTVIASNPQTWEWNGMKHRCCKRCGRIDSKPL